MFNLKKTLLFSIGLTSCFFSLAQLSFEYNFSNIDPNTYSFEEINCLPTDSLSNDIYNVTQSQNVKFTISKTTKANNNLLDGSLQMDFATPSEEWVINKFMFGNCQPTILDLSTTPIVNLTVKPSQDIKLKVATVIVDGNSFFVNDTLGSVLAIDLTKDTWQTIQFDIPAFFGTQSVDLTKVMGVAFQVTSSTNQRITNTSTELLIDQIKISDNKVLSTNNISTTQMTVFPNPTNGEILIKNFAKNSKINIINTLGKNVKQSKMNTIDISELATGIYFLQIIQNNQIIHSEKIIKN